MSTETIQWADGFLLVYSITDRQSFNYIKRIKQQLSEYKNANGGNNTSNSSLNNTLSVVGSIGGNNNGNAGFRENSNATGGGGGGNANSLSPIPIVLVGNKADMVHLRQISADEG